MGNDGTPIQARILERRALLDEAKTALKGEYFGINHVIDGIVDAISPWFLTPELQERPLVVNLWGLTGTGKTSLAIRLTELLGQREQLVQIDLGVGDFSYRLFNELEKLPRNVERKPRIFILDEFQNARTIDQKGIETEPRDLKILWSLLDSGKLIDRIWGSRGHNYYAIELRAAFAMVISEGIQIVDGKILGDMGLYSKILRRDKTSSDVFTESELLGLTEYSHEDPYIFQRRVAGMSAVEILRMLDGFCTEAMSQKEIDCSSSLVFVIGNLDEAFDMNDELSPDLQPDDFREATMKITVPIIKKALQKRFRNEQVSRLGNIHIIYPALGSEDYRQIIRGKLAAISDSIYSHYSVCIEMRTSIENLVFDEGVYPAQGTRPLLSTIESLVKSHLCRFLADAFREGLTKPERLVLDYSDGVIRSLVWSGGVIVDKMERECSLELGRLRENKRDDRQAIVSVHEAGHTAIAILLLGRIPALVRSRTTDANTLGFTSGSVFDSTLIKGELVKRLALLLGGRAAETLIFGDQMVTDGASSDLSEATNLALSAAKTRGMCEHPVSHREVDPSHNLYFHDRDGGMEKIADAWIEEARELAMDTLDQNQELLIELSKALFDQTVLKRKEIEILIHKYLPSFKEHEHVGQGSKGHYVATLNNRITALERTDQILNDNESVQVACSINRL